MYTSLDVILGYKSIDYLYSILGYFEGQTLDGMIFSNLNYLLCGIIPFIAFLYFYSQYKRKDYFKEYPKISY